ncbi:MAG: hypothetical protein JSS32_04010 [Verrucomicrobia bacterium]|nr:hypothetical protein [Verrucomicrobiota bacterium]
MAVRRKRKVKARKTTRRKVARKKTSNKSANRKAAAHNRQAQWQAYKHLEAQIDKAWAKLRHDVKKKASPQILMKDKNHLTLLLGECNYMLRQCVRQFGMAKRKRR